MPGGLMNLVSGGSGDAILTGNPTQSFFKTTYSKYTPFGIQMFRVDYQGLRSLSDNSPTMLKFKIPRYGDLLYDSYLCITIPDIYSDYRCSTCKGPAQTDPACGTQAPSIAPEFTRQDYQFAWVANLGYAMVKDISLSIGGSIITKHPGDWMTIQKVLGRTGTGSTLLDQMIGNIPECTQPSSTCGIYPTVPRLESRPPGHFPSIKGRNLFIPLEMWFCEAPSQAIPLVALQYQEVEITINLRPLSELYTIAVWPGAGLDTDPSPCDVTIEIDDNISENGSDTSSTEAVDDAPTCNIPFVPRGATEDPCTSGSAPTRSNCPQDRIQEWLSPSCAKEEVSLERFLENGSMASWAPDIHLVCRYVFLGEDERRVFAKIEQKYLVRMPTYIDFPSVDPSGKVNINLPGVIVNYVWRFQRSDVASRNEWSNYTNYAYLGVPNVPYQSPYMYSDDPAAANGLPCRPATNPPFCERFPAAQQTNDRSWNFYGIPPSKRPYTVTNDQEIMMSASLLLDGEVRETVFPAPVWNFITKYANTESSDLQLGVYFYSYALNNEIGSTQPSGALSMGKYSEATIEYTTITPPMKNPDPQGNAELRLATEAVNPGSNTQVSATGATNLETFVPGPSRYYNEVIDPLKGAGAAQAAAQRTTTDNDNAEAQCEAWNRASGAALARGFLTSRSKYTYNLRVYVERYNVLVITNGMGGLQYAL